MLTISDIYKDDLPDDSIFVLEYPTSHKDSIGNPKFLVNSSRYLVSSLMTTHTQQYPVFSSNEVDLLVWIPFTDLRVQRLATKQNTEFTEGA